MPTDEELFLLAQELAKEDPKKSGRIFHDFISKMNFVNVWIF